MSSSLKVYKSEEGWPHELFISEIYPLSDKKMKGKPLHVEVDMYWYDQEGVVCEVMTKKFDSESVDTAKTLCEQICHKNPTTEYTGKVRMYHEGN